MGIYRLTKPVIQNMRKISSNCTFKEVHAKSSNVCQAIVVVVNHIISVEFCHSV